MFTGPEPSLLILTEDSPESYSPAGARVSYMARAGALFFESVVILAFGASRNLPHTQQAKPKVFFQGINWSKGLPYPLSAFFDPLKALMLFIHGLKLSISLKPEYLLASMPPLEVGVSAWLLAKLLRKNLIVDLRDDWESAMEVHIARYIPLKLIKLLFKLSKLIYSFSICIFAATQTITNTVQRRGVEVSVLYVPNGADTSLFLPQNKEARNKTRIKYSLPLGKVVILYCGSGINPYYRLDMVLMAVKALPKNLKEKAFLVLYVYNGEDQLKKLKEELKMPNDLVEIRKPLQRSSLAEVMAACDVGLVPFDDKPYLMCARSTKLYEYLSCGLGIISSGPTDGELNSLLTSNLQLGLFTRPTVEGFAQAFVHVIENIESFSGDHAKALRCKFIEENFDRREIMKKAMQTFLANVNSAGLCKRRSEGEHETKDN